MVKVLERLWLRLHKCQALAPDLASPRQEDFKALPSSRAFCNKFLKDFLSSPLGSFGDQVPI